MKKHAIIVAGGIGSRMKSDVPKQFLLLAGEPVLMHTIRAFFEYDKLINIIVVLPSEQFGKWKELCVKYKFKIEHNLVEGGEKRFYSVKNALEKIDNSGVVAIHDGVRPLIKQEVIHRCFLTAIDFGTALPVCEPVESIRFVANNESNSVDRSLYKMVQTPQVFLCDIIIDAYKTEFRDSFTDDASVAEFSGNKIRLVDGDRENIKITTPVDLIIAEALMKARKSTI